MEEGREVQARFFLDISEISPSVLRTVFDNLFVEIAFVTMAVTSNNSRFQQQNGASL